MTLIDDVGAMKAIHTTAIRNRELSTLLGLCKGILADQVVNESEARYLRHWLHENENVAKVWPGNTLLRKIDLILSDDFASEEELDNLKKWLQVMLADTYAEDGTTSSGITHLKETTSESIIFPDRTFCFTGIFLYGVRRECESATTLKGGLCTNSVSRKLNYLVTGAEANDAYIGGSFGTKLQKAQDLISKGHPLKIISEELWQTAIIP
jgi:NAD-dependent DNA ligase